MNILLTILTQGRVTYAEGWDTLLKQETAGVIFALVVVAIPTLVLRYLFQETTRPRTRLILSGCMVLVYIATVLGLAWFLCTLGPATDAAQVWNAWVVAFLGGTAWTLIMVAIGWFCRPKRQLSEEAKMKLKDI